MELWETSLFNDVSPEDCARMAACLQASRRAFRGGSMVEWEHRRSVGVLLSGRISIVRQEAQGGQSQLEQLGPGGVFGEDIAFSGGEMSDILVLCAEDCEVLFIQYEHLIKRCEKACSCHSRLVANMLSLLSDKAQALSEKIEVISCRTIRARLSVYLRRVARKSGSPSFPLPMTMTALAGYLCVDRSALTREVRQMKEDGLLTIDRGQVTLLDALLTGGVG